MVRNRHTRSLGPLAGALLLLVLCTASSCATPPPVRVLVLYEDGGHHKPFTDRAVPWLQEQAPTYNLQLTTLTSTRSIDEAFLEDFDVVLQLDYAPYNWPEEAFRAMEKFVDEGRGGWVGLHHATLLGEFDGFPMWEWFSDFMGGIRYRDYMADLSDGTVHVEAPGHPVMKGVPDSFVLPDDEWYTYDRSPRLGAGIQVLATVDESSYSRPAEGKTMGDHPVAWTNTTRKARNVYFQFGHSPRLLDEEPFRRMMLNSILWAAGRPGGAR